MTGTPFDDESGAELMLRSRFESAVGDVSPDIARLVAGGAADGRGAVRRRRVVSGIAAAAVAVVAVGGVSLATQTDLLGKDDHATDNGTVEQLVPATPRGMAAALLARTDALDLGTRIAVGGTKTTPDHQPQISGQVAYDLGGGAGVEFDAFATNDVASVGDPCNSGTVDTAASCDRFMLDDGTPAWYLRYETGDSTAAAAALLVRREDQLVAVVETMSGTTSLVLDRAGLLAIATDPAIGMSTTDAFNTAGNQLADFREGGLTTETGSGSSSGVSKGHGSASPPSATGRHRSTAN
jgi:hypothetical protein